MFKFLGVIVLALALIIAIIPQFTTCESQGQSITLANGKVIPMKCNWTAKAELVTGVPLFVVGAMLAFSRRKENRTSLSILGVILGIAVILLATSLIGVCQSNMLCNTVMKPTLLVTGGFITALNLAGLWVAVGIKGRSDELSQVSHPKH